MIEIAEVRTPIGAVWVAARGDEVVQLAFSDGVSPAFAESRRAADPAGAASAIRAFFDGDIAALDSIEVAASGGAFIKRAWDAMRSIGHGETISYAELAARAGSPRAVRAAGQACASNPIPLIVPCHRIVRSDGSLGGYGPGLDRKRWLLAHERAHARAPVAVS